MAAPRRRHSAPRGARNHRGYKKNRRRLDAVVNADSDELATRDAHL
jgi:hypothetical protein